MAERIELVQIFDQNCFEHPDSEEEIALVRSKWDQWKSKEEFAVGCVRYAWVEHRYQAKDRDFCEKFCDSKTGLINQKFRVSIPEFTSEHTLICEDWNCEAVMWKEKSFYYLFSWSTTA